MAGEKLSRLETALQALRENCGMVSQGVALGWNGAAPLALGRMSPAV